MQWLSKDGQRPLYTQAVLQKVQGQWKVDQRIGLSRGSSISVFIESSQLYLHSTFHTQGRLHALHLQACHISKKCITARNKYEI